MASRTAEEWTGLPNQTKKTRTFVDQSSSFNPNQTLFLLFSFTLVKRRATTTSNQLLKRYCKYYNLFLIYSLFTLKKAELRKTEHESGFLTHTDTRIASFPSNTQIK